MASYNDRLGNFNSMLNTTSDHVKGIADAAKKVTTSSDPVGAGLNLTNEIAGGITNIAGGVTGIQHFKDFKTMYNGLQSSLKNGPASAPAPATPASTGAGAAGGAPVPAPRSAASLSRATQDLTEGSEMPAGADSDALSEVAGLLSGATQDLTEGSQIPSSTTSGEATGTQGSNGQNAVTQTPDNNANPVASDNTTNLAPDANAGSSTSNASGDLVNTAESADGDASGIIAQGQSALSNLGLGNIPSSLGGAITGLRNIAGDVGSQAVNAGAQVQQQVGDQAQHALSGLSNPNGPANTNAASSGSGAGADGGAAAGAEAGVEGGGEGLAAAGAGAAEGLTTAATFEGAAAFAGPAAPIVGLVGGIIGLGTEIASAFKPTPPPPKAVAPPPAATISVGGNLKDAMSGSGGGIY